MTPEEQTVQQKVAASGSSFYYAFLFLPAERRAAITAFYAFCREVDDVVDEASDPGVAQTKLDWWRREVQQAFAGRPQHPVMKALLPHVPRFGIPERALHDVIAGCQMDLDQNRYLDYPALQRYCHLVAGVVGEVAARIFGQTDDATTAYAHKLGLALQLTNIVRDVGEDAVRGRIYLPVNELQRFNVKAHELLKRGQGAVEADFGTRFEALMRFQIERAREHYRRAWDLLPAADRKAQRIGLVMAAIYRATLDEIALDGPGKVLNQRLSLSPGRKIWLAWKTWTFGYKP